MEIPGEAGSKAKVPSIVGVWIFSGTKLSKKLCPEVSIASPNWTRPRMTSYARMLKITSGVFIAFIALKRPYNKYYLSTESEVIISDRGLDVLTER